MALVVDSKAFWVDRPSREASTLMRMAVFLWFRTLWSEKRDFESGAHGRRARPPRGAAASPADRLARKSHALLTGSGKQSTWLGGRAEVASCILVLR